jgi:hypothetical protein
VDYSRLKVTLEIKLNNPALANSRKKLRSCLDTVNAMETLQLKTRWEIKLYVFTSLALYKFVR